MVHGRSKNPQLLRSKITDAVSAIISVQEHELEGAISGASAPLNFSCFLHVNALLSNPSASMLDSVVREQRA